MADDHERVMPRRGDLAVLRRMCGRPGARPLPRIARGGMTEEILDFSKKCGVSLDWPFIGDLKGLHRMMQDPRAQQFRAKREKLLQERDQIGRILDIHDRLPSDQQRIITAEVNRLIAEQTTNEPQPA